jgi:hypothetical protein
MSINTSSSSQSNWHEIAIRGYGIFNVYKLWEESKHAPIVDIQMGMLTHLLSDPIWDDDQGVSITPVQVMTDKTGKYLMHQIRIDSADLSFPILLYLEKDGYTLDVMDGMHRLAKAFIRGMPTIHARFLTDTMLANTKVADFPADTPQYSTTDPLSLMIRTLQRENIP